MIGYIKGEIINLKENRCIVLTTSGIGYEIFIPLSYLNKNRFASGKKVELFIKTIVKDNDIELYGFLTEEEKALFVKLIGISKLGPKSAMALLSYKSPHEIFEAISTEDAKALSRIPGIGQKTAKRIILELKEKIKSKNANLLSKKDLAAKESSTFKDALSGLLNLGYREEEVFHVLEEVLSKEPDLLIEETIRKVLKKMTIKTYE
jgi:Holliday junction DNA helicase RuvA